MATFDELSIEIMADTASAKAGLQSVRSELNDLDGDALTAAGALEQTRRSTDDLKRSSLSLAGGLASVATAASRADDTVEEAGDSATHAAGSFTLLSGALSGTATSFVAVGATSVQAAAGLTLVASAMAAATAIGLGLAAVVGSIFGAFGLLLGAGLVTHMEEIQRTLGRTIPQIKAALEPLGEVFGPLLIDGIQHLDELTENIVSAVGGTAVFADTLRRFGRFALTALPTIVGFMFDIARLALPALLDGLEFLRENGPAAFGVIKEGLKDVGPELIEFGKAVAKIAPELAKVGFAIAKHILPPLTALVNTLGELLKKLNKVPGGSAIAGLVLGGIAFGGLGAAIGGAVKSIGALTTAASGAAGALSGLSASSVLLAGKFAFIGGAILAAAFGLFKFAEFAFGQLKLFAKDLLGLREPTKTGPPTLPGQRGQVTRTDLDPTPKTEVNVDQINASSRLEGREAARGFKEELGNTLDTSRTQ